MSQTPDRYKNVLSFLLSERFLTLTVIGSVFTFSFIASLKADIIDPLLHFVLPEENFGFMDVVIRDGVEIPQPKPKQLELKLGNFFREFVTWLFTISVLYLLAKYTRFPDTMEGNILGAAIM